MNFFPDPTESVEGGPNGASQPTRKGRDDSARRNQNPNKENTPLAKIHGGGRKIVPENQILPRLQENKQEMQPTRTPTRKMFP